MTAEIDTPPMKAADKKKKKLFAVLAVGAMLLAGGVTFASVSVANANAAETARLCAVALEDGADAAKATTESATAADSALEAVVSTTLPADAGTSTDYAARAGVEAVAASEGSDGVEAVDARGSGAELISQVADARAALVKITIPTTCTTRHQAETITAKTEKSTTAANVLASSVPTLTADFAVFQTDEAARIAAEIEAARVAAEAEAARVAAETEAARVAAEQAAAEEASHDDSDYSDSGSSSGGSSSGGPSSSGGGSSSGSDHPSGGGDIGLGTNNGVCWTSNGMGGTMPC